MSFLNLGKELEERHELHCVDAGEYELRIVSAAIYKDKTETSRDHYLGIRFEVTNDPFSKEISDIFTLPGWGASEKEENQNRNRIGYFFEAFGIDPSGDYNVNEPYPEGLVGSTGWAMVTEGKDDGKGYGEQNRIKAYVRGH
jgi:hypothetical protein